MEEDAVGDDFIPEDQTDIIAQAKEIEEYIEKNSSKEENDKNFIFLNALMDLFKSELATSFSMRQAIINYRVNTELARQFDEELSKLFNLFADYDGNIDSLGKILKFCENVDPNSIKKKIDLIKNSMRQYTDETEELKLNIDKMKLEKVEVEENAEYAKKKLSQSKELDQKLENLTQELKILEKDKAEYQELLSIMSGKNSNERLKEQIVSIDETIEEITHKIDILDQRHSDRCEDLHAQINKAEFDIEELTETRRQIEAQLDEAHQQLNYLTNPIHISGDINSNIFASERNLSLLKEEFEELIQKKVRAEKIVKNSHRDLARIKNELLASRAILKKDEEMLTELHTTYENLQSSLSNNTSQRNKLVERERYLRELEETKRNTNKKYVQILNESDALKQKSRELTLEGHKLMLSIEKTQKSITTLKENYPIDNLSEFNDAIDTFRFIRDTLGLTKDINPDQIVDFVLSYL